MESRLITQNLVLYGFAHAVIDATCAALVFSLLNHYTITSENFIMFVILYNVLAFGLQPLIGFGVDRFHVPRDTAIAGVIVTMASVIVFLFAPLTAVIFAGIGNALFHVGAGTISLNLTPRKATAPGIYVAPGALGLLVGTILGKSGYFIAWMFLAVLLLIGICMLFVTIPKIDYEKKRTSGKFSYFELIIVLVLLAVVARALIGSLLVFPWKKDMFLLVVLTLSIVLGKALGGFLADRFGWIRVSVSALVLSAPLLAFGVNVPLLAILGIFLFNITMPVTLVAVSNTLPGRPGFAFGLTTLALIIGALPAFTSLKTVLNTPLIILVFVIVSSAVLYFGLKLYYSTQPN